MTMKVTDSIKFTRKDHPNEKNYPNRASFETGQAYLQALEYLSHEDFCKLAQGTLVHDEEQTAELFDQILVGDFVGLCLHDPSEGWVASVWEIKSIDRAGDKMHGITKHKPKRERDIYFEDVSAAMVFGKAEILYRDGKPFGISDEDLTITYSIVDLSKKEEHKENVK